MYPDQSLKENVPHGTAKRPVHALHFAVEEGDRQPFFVARHWHDEVEILFIRKGSYLVEINLENHVLQEGDICILNSGEPHQLTGQDMYAVHDAILFDPRILDFSYRDEWEERYIAPFLSQALVFENILHPPSDRDTLIWLLMEKLMEEALQKGIGWYIRCKLLILELFAHMTKQGLLLAAREVVSADDARKISRYKTIISYIEEHYGEPISLQQLADTIPCNSQYLCRFFREIAGISPIQYLIHYRLEKACYLLVHTSRQISEIALDCGFDNISYFIRKFKERKGCTPKDYRRDAQL